MSGIILNKIHLSELSAAKGDTLESQKFAKEALQFSRETNVSSDILASLQQLSSVEHKNAAKYSKEYIKINDSVQQEERKAKDKSPVSPLKQTKLFKRKTNSRSKTETYCTSF
ncbi:MAG: hypothetical protein IPN80_00750 [Flavobacterium sp.]|nr:hypothetical protein [Flavobacterium sp.]